MQVIERHWVAVSHLVITLLLDRGHPFCMGKHAY